MIPFVGGGGDGGGDCVLGSELPPSTLAEDGRGLSGLQRCDLQLQSCLHTRTDEPQMEPHSGA